jgi:iron(III) transport system substrate-binding protein
MTSTTGRTIVKNLTAKFAALAVLLLPMAAGAQEAPALKDAGARKAQVQGLIAAAAKEGEFSYWDAVIQQETNTALVNGFRKYYGLPSSFKVNYTLSNTAGLVTRVDQEMQAGRVTMDVVGIALLPWVHEKVRGGHVMKYESPQYASFKSAFANGLGKDGYFAFNGAYIFVPMWNPDNVKFAGTSWMDVVGAVPSGRLSIGDASKSVTYLATYLGQRKVLGVDYFKKLAAMKPTFLVRSEQIANQLVTGQDLMAYSGMPTRAYQFNSRGAGLKFIQPKEGVILLPQAMFIPAKAPHPAAGKLWVDYILSEEGQKIVVQGEAMISGRDGFVSPLPEYAPPIDKLNVIKIDWEKITEADQTKAKQEWLSIFNP